MEAYIVACSDLHGAVGPFATREAAGEAAMRLNGSGRTACTYQVVKCFIALDNLKVMVESIIRAGSTGLDKDLN